MNFEKAKKVVKLMLFASVAACIVSLIVSENGTPLSAYVMLAALGLLVFAFIVAYNFCKCPFCGKRILLGVLTVTHCPACRRNLVTGERKKGSGGKKIRH